MSIIRLLNCFILTFFLIAPAFAECTQKEAFDKMMALSVAKSDIQTRMNSLPNGSEKNNVMRRWANLGREIAEVGKLLGSKQYTRACQEYDQIASKYAVDLNELSKRAPRIEEHKNEKTR